MKIADYLNEPNYAGWASMDSWPLKCGIDLIAAHMAKEANSPPDDFDKNIKDNNKLVFKIVMLGINSGKLKCDIFDWFVPELDDESIFSSLNSFVAKDEFLRFVEDRGLPVHSTLWESVRPAEAKEAKLRPEQEAKFVCQGVAIALWNTNPDMTITDMANEELLLSKGGGNMYSEKTRKDWVSEVDPRPKEKKTGPKRQQ